MKSRHRPPGESPGLLERFHASIDHGDHKRAGKLLRRLEAGGERPVTALARWRLLSLADDLVPARQAAASSVQRYPDDPDLQHALGWTLLELDLIDEALGHLEEAVYLDEGFADAWYDLGLAREVAGDGAGMRAAFTRVYSLDTGADAPKLRFSEDQVMAWAERAYSSLPDAVLDAAQALPVFVQDYPDPWILEAPPWDPRLLGLFDGPTWAELQGTWGEMQSTADLPGATAHVYLYQRNLERVCADARCMAEQVRITLHHEVGHFLGLDEHDLDERGLG